MKKILLFFIVVIVFTFIYLDSKKIDSINVNKEVDIKEIKKEEMRGVFISYMELNTYIRDKDIDTAKENINTIIKNIRDNNFNTIILHVRSYDDSIYDSTIFSLSKSVILNDGSHFDVLKYFIDKCDDIDLYVWINPFRITRPNEEIDKDTFAYRYKDSDVVKKVGDIYYYNPSSPIAINHIISGILELLQKYKFKGLLFDDYFYPSKDIDTIEYEEYKKNNDISLEDYHLMIINDFIKEVYSRVKKVNKDILFGISPDGNIENNYNKNYADVKTWCSNDGYIDFIMPQLYYGFHNTNKPFKDTMEEWSSIITNDNIKLYSALAFYKVGTRDLYAKDGINEWVENSDVIKRQIILLRNNTKYSGFSLFRYDNLFNKNLYNDNSINEFNNLKSILKNY